MITQHINHEGELTDVLQTLPSQARYLIIDAVGLPVGNDKYPETLSEYVDRITEQLCKGCKVIS